MPAPRKRCKQCRRHESEADHISRNGLCGECGQANYLRNLRQQIARMGPLWDKRVVAMERSRQR